MPAAEISRQVATDIMIIEDEPLAAQALGFEAILGAFLAGLLVRALDPDPATTHPLYPVKLEAVADMSPTGIDLDVAIAGLYAGGATAAPGSVVPGSAVPGSGVAVGSGTGPAGAAGCPGVPVVDDGRGSVMDPLPGPAPRGVRRRRMPRG